MLPRTSSFPLCTGGGSGQAAINVRGPIIAIQAALRHIGEGGRIITIGSYFADRISSHLASDKARYITGKELTVDGGANA